AAVETIIGNNQEHSSQAHQSVTIEEEQAKMATYYILFRPNEYILMDGTNPLYLLDELSTLGISKVTAHLHNIPKLDEINSECCYVFWDIYLATNVPVSTIEEVFIFVLNDCQLEVHKVADENLLENDAFIEKIDKELSFKEVINIDELQAFAGKLFQGKHNKPVEKVTSSAGTFKKENVVSSIRVSSDKLDDLMNLVSELVTTQASLSLFAEQSNIPELMAIAENMEKISRRLRDNTFSICLIPIENMLTRFQRLVRDLSQELGKKIELKTEGTDTELDKSIIESLADPILHILRNSIDHGIEDSATRKKLGKSETGTILFKAYYSGTHVIIEINDDGKGIDPEKIRAKAIDKGLITAEAQLSEKEIFDLVFLPGFSTAQQVTEVSGRGVGMDVVMRKINEIRGEVSLKTKPNEGTSTIIKLPLTLSIIDGLLVKIKDTFFVISLASVSKVHEVNSQKIVNTFNNLVVLDGKQVPFLNLHEEFKVSEDLQDTLQMVVVNYDDNEVGLTVDEVIGEYQAVLKPLGKLYKDIDIISGATILGDGTIALVLDTNKIIKNFSEKTYKMEEIR
ncbi:MAG: chemotaxis protein CheA, partial [Cyclobacteriaceae bacterium]